MNIQHLTLAQLEEFDSRSPNRGRERRFACPLCGHNKPIDAPHRSLAVNTENGSFFCHRCQTKGRLREFWDETRLITPKRKKTRLKLISQFSLTKKKDIKEEKNEDLDEKIRKYRSEFLHSPAEIYLLNRYIPTDIGYRAGCGYAEKWEHWEKNNDKWKLQGIDRRVVFPIYNQAGKIVAVHGRAIDENHYASSKITRGDKSQGLFLSDANVLNRQYLAICEGAIDAMSLAVCGIPAVAMTGTTPPDWFYRKMAFKNILLATDADEAGDKSALKLQTELITRGAKVFRLRPKLAKDWGEVLEQLGEDEMRNHLSAFQEKLSDSERLKEIMNLLSRGRRQAAEFVAELLEDLELRQNLLYQLRFDQSGKLFLG